MNKRVIINLAVVVALLILGAIGWQAVRDRQTAAEFDRWQIHSYQVIQQFDELLSDLNDVEAGQRNFLITTNRSDLAQYEQMLGRVERSLAALRNLTKDNPQQQQRLAALTSLIRSKHTVNKETLALNTRNGLEAARRNIITGRSAALLEDIRKAVAEAKADEARLLNERAVAKETSQRNASRTLVVGGLISLLVLAVAVLLLQHEVTMRSAAEQELRRGSDRLQDLVEERTRELRQAEQSHARLAAIVESSRDAIISESVGGRIETWNNAAEKMFGYTAAEVLGKSISILVPPERTREDKEVLRREQSGEVVEHFETTRIAKDGRRIAVSLTVSPVRDKAGRLAGVSKTLRDISERKRVQEALRESEERLGLALTATGLGTWDYNPVTGALEWNARCKELFGLPPNAEVNYDTFLAGLHPEERERVHTLVQHTLARPGAAAYDTELRTVGLRDGGIVRWLRCTGRAYFDAAGRATRFIGTAHDITERKRAEAVLHEHLKQLQEAEAALRAKDAEVQLILSHTPFMLTRCTRDLHYRYASAAYAKMLGRTPAELAGKPIPEIMGEKGFETIRPHVEAVLRGEKVEYEAQVEFKGVGPRDLRITYLPEWDEQQQPVGWIASLMDISERKQAEEALRTSEEKFAMAFAENPAAIAMTRLEDRVFMEVNDSWVALMGYHREEVIGRVATQIPIWPTAEAAARFGAELKAKGSLRGWEQDFRKKSGERFVAQLASQTLTVRGEKVILSTLVDITERKKFQAELERLVAERTAKLQELVGELEHFSYTITHDMRAPLRAMHGFAEMLGESCPGCREPEPQAFLQKIMTSAERMDALIIDALSYSRAVREELPLAPVDGSALLRGMLDSYPELQPSKAQISLKGDIPLVMANEAGLTQCFSNLLGNAAKFVKPGQKPEISVRAEQREGWVRIWVEDKGIGISEAMRPRVFDLFARGHRDYEGTGIGLALVRKVMDRMGGRVGFESKEGRGSRFWLDLMPGDVRHPRSAAPVSPSQLSSSS